MIVTVTATHTYTGKIDTDKVITCWSDEYDEWRQRENVTQESDATTFRFIQALAQEIGGLELIDVAAHDYRTTEETEVHE